MKIQELMRGTEYEIVQQGDADDITSVVIDSRKAKAGCLFVCIRGLNVDGHRFINDVNAAGAAAVLIDEKQEAYPPGLTVVKVSQTRVALCAVAANFYGNPGDRMRLVGITGTNGKTSTAYFLETILDTAGRKTGVIGTIGTRVGDEAVEIPFDTSTTPDTLELMEILSRMRELGAEDVVMEVSSHALSLNKVDGLRFEAGILTNITQDHLDFHGTMENYREAKERLFTLCRFGIVNADDESAAIVTRGKRCGFTTYGLEKDCDLKAVHIEYLPEGSSFDIEIDGAAEHFYLPAKGRFNIYNCLAAIGAALSLNVPVADIRRGVARIQVVPGRIQNIENNLKDIHVLVDYAHTPDGLVSVINAVREFTKGRVVTLFGCGGDKDKSKRPMMGRIAGELSDYCVLTSDNPRSEQPEDILKQIEKGITDTNCPYQVFVNRKDAIRAGVMLLEEGDSLIIAGKGHEDYQIIGGMTIHFDDVETAREILREKEDAGSRKK
ncbi:MAG: UDP-N-acetylmuramoyl-L-alanyl-D-glutamate--2,6-diaminopimelate ligase [Clostridiales bacterium]|jgi:UDP-N-acetylmuramoyl-L-alanyl-D-glutamate--2,6-diaminopimelate ligase|nr:UDP-N-acetylmuramoyl-L-alanyl-D-glutamate--2,6-diaminopimelate ligase [Clostridiales bacterium]